MARLLITRQGGVGLLSFEVLHGNQLARYYTNLIEYVFTSQSSHAPHYR